jgi:hypothetical protein
VISAISTATKTAKYFPNPEEEYRGNQGRCRERQKIDEEEEQKSWNEEDDAGLRSDRLL